MSDKILIVEDDNHIAEGLSLNLNLTGYSVRIANDGLSALELWKSWEPDLVILDLMLPEIDGVSVLRSIRLENEKIPVLVLSAKTTPEDKVECFRYGVDDYLEKPFDLDEFLLRVERLLKRVSWNIETYGDTLIMDTDDSIYSFGNNQIDFNSSTAISGTKTIKLTEQEVRLLKLLTSNPNKPLSRKQLLEIGWGYSSKTETRTIDNFIVRFRKYFESHPKQPVYFISVRSIGYMFNPD